MTQDVLAPVRRQIVVRCTPVHAFQVFTAGIGRWWPLMTHSIARTESASVSMTCGLGGDIVETLPSGTVSVWGTVTTWQPPRRLAFTWHPGYAEDETGSEVEVTFTDHEEGTLVELVHTGFERIAEGARKRVSYDVGWVPVLEGFAAEAGAVDAS